MTVISFAPILYAWIAGIASATPPSKYRVPFIEISSRYAVGNAQEATIKSSTLSLVACIYSHSPDSALVIPTYSGMLLFSPGAGIFMDCLE